MTKKSFSQIVPLWSKKLRKGAEKAIVPCVIDGKTLDIRKYSCCIVGEAYKFQQASDRLAGYSVYNSVENNQYCGDCRYFASRFDSILEDLAYAKGDDDEEEIIKEKKNLASMKKHFVNHWNEKHENV